MKRDLKLSSELETSFSKLMCAGDYPMVIVTTAHGDKRAGCVVGFATQCSVHPPRYLICSSEKNYTYSVLQEADALAVHFLAQHQLPLAELFGGQSGHAVDKFEQCKWREGPLGVPILEECGAWFVGRIGERHKVGDHELIIVDPVAVECDGEHLQQLMFQQAKHIEPGHDV